MPQTDWTKEEKLEDSLTIDQRDIIEHMIQFYNNAWVPVWTILEEMGDYGGRGYANLQFNLHRMIKKGLIVTNKEENTTRLNQWDIKLTDKGRYAI